MKTTQNMNSEPTIEQQLSSISMFERVRSAALHDARIAGMFVGAIVWVCGKVSRPHADVFAKPDLKF